MTEQFVQPLLGAMGKGNGPCDASKAAQAADDLSPEERRAVNFARKLDRIAFRVTNQAHAASTDRELWETTISRFRLLRVEEEQQLTWIFKHHPSEQARRQAYDLMILCNQRMLRERASYFHRGLRDSTVDLEDLVSAGQQGMHEAMEQFDPARGFKFSTYARDKIDMRVRRHVEGNDRRTGVRFPTGVYHKIAKVRGFMRAYEDEHGVKPTLEQVMDHTGMKEDVATDCMIRAQVRGRSLDEMVRGGDGADAESTTFGHMIEDEDAGVEEAVEQRRQRRMIEAAMSTLDPRERAVVGSVYGYGQLPTGENFNRIAERFSMRVDEARAIFKSGIAKMRDELADIKRSGELAAA